MYIKHLRIEAFGVLRDREVDLSDGLNIIEGANESGKSALAMFIKFMLYGLSGKATGGELSERRRYVNWETGTAAGSMTVSGEEGEFRIERHLSASMSDDGSRQRETVRETVRIIDTALGTPVHRGEVPGDVIFHVPEAIFMNTVFVRQIDGTRPSGESILSSIENLLFTANENVSTKKAMERLDTARKQILHKNGGGGELYTCKEERSMTAARLRAAQEQIAALLSEENELTDAQTKCEALREKIRRQKRICEYGEINLIRRRFDTAIAGNQKLAVMRSELAKRNEDGIDRAFVSRLKESAARISEQSTALAQMREANAVIRDRHTTASDKHRRAESEIGTATTRADSLLGRMRLTLAIGLTLVLFAILAGLGAWLLYTYEISLLTIPLAGAGALLALAILCFIIRGRAARNLRDLLTEWDAPDVDSLPAAIADAIGAAGDLETLSNESRQMSRALSDMAQARRTEAKTGLELSGRVLSDLPTPDETDEDAYAAAATEALVQSAKAAEEICAEREEMQRAIDKLSGRLSVLQEQLQGENEEEIRRVFAENLCTPEGKIASGLDAARLEEAKQFLTELQNALREEEEKHHNLETRVAASRAVSVSPVELAGRLSELDEQINSLTMRHEAYCLAMETLQRASDTMRAGVLPKVVAQACASANRISGGAFEAIGVDHGLSMTFTRNGMTREVEYLSEGTKDIAYISLRRALSGALFGDTQPPLIYDESFARVDETRLSRVLKMLNATGKDGSQSILLTCRRLEAELAETCGGANVIRL